MGNFYRRLATFYRSASTWLARMIKAETGIRVIVLLTWLQSRIRCTKAPDRSSKCELHQLLRTRSPLPAKRVSKRRQLTRRTQLTSAESVSLIFVRRRRLHSAKRRRVRQWRRAMQHPRGQPWWRCSSPMVSNPPKNPWRIKRRPADLEKSGQRRRWIPCHSFQPKTLEK